jgi:hypothetical protein
VNAEVDPADAQPAANRYDALAVLLARSRERLARLGQEPSAGHFVCPSCLRLLPERKASRGHYPADALPGGSAQTELQCTDCNYVVSRYEVMAINFFTREWDLGIGVPDLPGRVRAKGRVTSADGKVNIDLTRFSAKAKRDFETLRARSTATGRVTFNITEPTPEAAVRPLLAWSFLAWFYYAGYLYAASPGAALVRRLILHPEDPLPETVIYSRGYIDRPLPRPEPVIIIATEGGRPATKMEDVTQWIGIGASWGATTVAMPFANDAEGSVWKGLKALHDADELSSIGLMPLRKMLSIPLIEKGLTGPMVIQNKETEERWAVADDLASEDVERLVAGHSPYLIVPTTVRRSRAGRRGG